MAGPVDRDVLDRFDYTAELIASVRAVRQEKGISPKDPLQVLTQDKSPLIIDTLVEKLAGVTAIDHAEEKPAGAVSFLVRTQEYFIPLGDRIDREAEREKLEKELQYTEGFLASVRKNCPTNASSTPPRLPWWKWNARRKPTRCPRSRRSDKPFRLFPEQQDTKKTKKRYGYRKNNRTFVY